MTSFDGNENFTMLTRGGGWWVVVVAADVDVCEVEFAAFALR